MKDKILIFIIGLLIGAVIASTVFLIHEKVNKKNYQMPDEGRMQMFERPDKEIPNNIENDGKRPEIPSKNKTFTENNKGVI